MGSGIVVVERMDQHVAALSGAFVKYLARFTASEPFDGPSLYFHQKALALRARHTSIRTLVDDDAFFAAVATALGKDSRQ